ncbi:hypothetical protein P3342_001030 [Pyrenophora teres f. teres]|nr:hypothetical protein P3342_001030 [Pyrenophora teres f. teres]
MALPTPQLTQRASEYGSDIDINSIATPSDYGSDIDIDDDTILADAFETINQGAPAEKSAVLPSVEFEEGELEDEEQDVDGFVQIHKPALLRVAKGTSRVDADAQRDTQSSPMRRRTTLEVEYDEISRRAWSVPLQDPASPSKPSPTRPYRTATKAKGALPPSEAVQVAEEDTRSPLERFRTKPKKPLSVTDLISPAWCELQYFTPLASLGANRGLRPCTLAQRYIRRWKIRYTQQCRYRLRLKKIASVFVFGMPYPVCGVYVRLA